MLHRGCGIREEADGLLEQKRPCCRAFIRSQSAGVRTLIAKLLDERQYFAVLRASD